MCRFSPLKPTKRASAPLLCTKITPMPAVTYPLVLHIDASNQYQFMSWCRHIAADKVNFIWNIYTYIFFFFFFKFFVINWKRKECEFYSGISLCFEMFGVVAQPPVACVLTGFQRCPVGRCFMCSSWWVAWWLQSFSLGSITILMQWGNWA